MSTELFIPRSFTSATRDYGSTFSCSSSEASSRLAARLERSEYKRSRAKQRLSNSSKSHSRRKDSRLSRKKNAATRETRTKSEEDGVTSVWEVYRQNPYYYSDRTTEDKRDNRNTWCGVPNSTSNEPSKRRPQSIHIGASDYNNSEYQSRSPGKHAEWNSYNDNVNDSNGLELSKETGNPDSNYSSHRSPLYRESQKFTEIQGDYGLDKKGMYLSRSLSSSFSSYVGSSDEKEDSQGIYSAYDVASRSPYESMVSRRYSQSSLSSSNASWHQHQSPSLNYNMRDIPPLLDPTALKSNQRSYSKKPSYHQSEFKEEFQTINEFLPPAVALNSKKFSSSYTIQLHSSPPNEPSYHSTSINRSSANATKEQGDRKGSTVREIARKFTPTSVRHISSVYNKQDDRNKHAETRISAATVAHQESSPPLEKSYSEVPQPRAALTDERSKVVMRQKEPSNKTPEELASNRLSLQELIQLHEEQIAMQTKSAKTVLAHAFLKHSPETSPKRSNDIESNVNSTTVQYDLSKLAAGYSELKEEKADDSYKASTSLSQQDHVDYEVREVVVSQSSPFKVIELTDKVTDTPRGRGSRLKRHRTIGIVGYRHQIDRTSGEKVQTKLKRHTTVGIFSDFTDSSEGLTKSREAFKQELQKVSPLRNEQELDHGSSVDARQDSNKKPFPYKVYEIESDRDQPKVEQEKHSDEEFTSNVVEEQQIQNVAVECWYSEASPDNAFLELENENKYIPAIESSTDKAESTSSVTVQPQQEIVQSRPATITEKYSTSLHDTSSRNSHSPVVELLPERKGTPAVYYKSPTANYSYSNTKDLTSDIPHKLHVNKSHLIPVAQVSPVSHSLGSQDILEGKSTLLASPPPLEPPTPHEMYQTRLALWDLLPHKEKSSSDLSEHQSHEGRFSIGRQSKQSHHSKEKSPVKFIGQTYDSVANTRPDESRFSLNFQRLEKTEEYYLNVIETLKADNQRLKEKSEAEKRDFKRMYEEQKKVANAYQKLEDRYRRRVHELQDALANCTCHGSLMLNESSLNSSNLTNGRAKENHTYKLQESSKSGMRMFEELEEWLSEQSKNSKAPKINANSRDSLISSSSDLTGTGWDEHFVSGGDIDEVNGTHV